MVLAWILGFAFLGSVGAIAGAASFLLFPKQVRKRLVPYLVSYATGTLLGAALLGLLPEAIEQGGALPRLGGGRAGWSGQVGLAVCSFTVPRSRHDAEPGHFGPVV